MTATFDTQMMARALQLARKGRYWAAPNPHVGCVLVRDGDLIGEGFTQPAGGNHAEIEALNSAGNASGATAYVTLEPCCHTGRTGPCSEALIAAGVKRVVVALADPNPQVSGGGIARLEQAGVQVDCGLLESQARQEIAGFVARMERGYGLVRAKLAMSFDGRTAMASGESQWITGAAARADVQRLRARSGVIVTGVGTVLSDDCALSVRCAELGLAGDDLARASYRQPDRLVLDSKLSTPAEARVLQGGNTVLCHRENLAPSAELLACGAEFVALPETGQGLDLNALTQLLGQRQYNEILVESGPRLAAAMLQAGLLDEVIVYMAPVLMGSEARPLFDLPIQRMADKQALHITDVRPVGSDWRFTLTASE